MADLVVVVPSRGRPGQAAALADACAQTCTADTWLIVAVDADDPTLPDYDAAMVGRPHAFVHTVETPGGHVAAINAGAREALNWKTPTYALAKLDDDHMPRTYAWDAMMLAALDAMGGTGIVYPNDLLQGENLPTAPVISADIVRALGYMAPPCLTHLYCDNWWKALGDAAGCIRYLPEVIVEHRHPTAGKAPWDAGYARANDPAQYQRDGHAYGRHLADGAFADEVAKVKALR